MLDQSVDADVSADHATASESARAVLASIYERPSADAHVATVHGYGVQIRIEHGQLVIRDGIGKLRRERKYDKIDRTLRRIIMTTVSGFISLESYKWCADHDITITMLSPDGELISAWNPDHLAADARLIRRQALAVTDRTATDIARELLTRKVRGQADTLMKYADDRNSAERLYRYADRMIDSANITQTKSQDSTSASLSELEGWSAREYFSAWQSCASMQWDSHSASLIPAHWRSYRGRISLVSGGARKQSASDPVNAMLNYAYTVAESEARTACIACGLDPRLGFIHTDKPGRDSLALDVLEALRPEVDDFILSMIRSRTFTYRQFAQPYGYAAGTCRIVAPLTHEIAEQSWRWRAVAMKTAQLVAEMLSGNAGMRGDHTHNLMLVKTAFQSESVTADDVLPENVWQAMFADIVPPWPRKTFRPPMPDRTVIAGMIHCDRHNRPWSHVPGSLGVSHRTMTDRRRHWQRLGSWAQIRRVIDKMISDD
jgi:CRISPR-associated endonuclease Cas1